MKKIISLLSAGLLIIFSSILFAGCTFVSDERIKLRDLDFTILSEEVVPEELKKIIDEKQGAKFRLTYSDNDNLYICIGYGEQQGGGYSITVNELYLADNAIYVNTALLKPDNTSDAKISKSSPYVVIKTELLDETVIFE